MALEMEYLLSSDEMRSQRSTVLPPLPAMSSISAPVEARDAGEGASAKQMCFQFSESSKCLC